jgi:hypothetical protein
MNKNLIRLALALACTSSPHVVGAQTSTTSTYPSRPVTFVDTFPFGIEENRATWEQMALYTFQQGIAHKQFTPQEIFPTGMMTKVVI